MRKLLTVGAVSLAMTLPMAAQAKKQLKNYVAATYNAQADYEVDANGTSSESDSGTGFRVDAQYFVSNSIAVIGRFGEDTYEPEVGNDDLTSTRMEIGARAFMPIGNAANAFFGVTYSTQKDETDTVENEFTIVAAQIGASGVVAKDIQVWGLAKIGTFFEDDSSIGGMSTELELGVSYRFYNQYAAHIMVTQLKTESDGMPTTLSTVDIEQDYTTIGVGVSYLF